jgi:hypothetical protein
MDTTGGYGDGAGALAQRPGRVAGDDRDLWLSIRRWALRAGVTAVGLWALFQASHPASQAGYLCGLGTFVLAVLGVFWDVKREFDGKTEVLGLDFVVANLEALWIVVPLHGILALIGLTIAARGEGMAAYGFGLGLAAWCCIAVFLSIKAGFDAAERRG